MSRIRILCFVALLSLPVLAQTGETTALRDRWRLASACNVHADGATVSVSAFATSDWLKTTVPSTVLAAQAANKVFPDPYFGTNLRNIPGTSYPVGQNFSNLPMPQDSPYRCGWWYHDRQKQSRLLVGRDKA